MEEACGGGIALRLTRNSLSRSTISEVEQSPVVAARCGASFSGTRTRGPPCCRGIPQEVELPFRLLADTCLPLVDRELQLAHDLTQRFCPQETLPRPSYIKAARFPQEKVFQDELPFARDKRRAANSACYFQIDGLGARLSFGNLIKRKAAWIIDVQDRPAAEGCRSRSSMVFSAYMRNILMRTFGRPQGFMRRLGGMIMARTNTDFGTSVSDLLEVGPKDSVLEVGFGPGAIIQHLSERATAGYIAGVDQSKEMVEQARVRNVIAIESGRVDLRHCSVFAIRATY